MINLTPHRALTALAALAVTVAVAACGSSSNTKAPTSTSAATSNTASSSRTALASCLRQHGVTFPAGRGPGAGGPPGGGSGAPPAGAAGAPPTGGPPAGSFPGGGAGNSKFRSALKACGANFPAGGRRFTISHTAIDNYVKCVRQHGYDLPTPNFARGGSVFPASARKNPKFQKASRACQSILAAARPTPPSQTSTTS